MFNLIKNELYKIFHKKSTYIVLFITLLYAILVNVMYSKLDNYVSYTSGYDNYNLKEMRNYIANFNPKTDDVYLYSDYSATIDVNDYALKYGLDSWQTQVINEYLYSISYDYHNSLYDEFADKSKAMERYNNFIKNLENDNWQYFVNSKIEETKKNIEEINNQINVAKNDNEIKTLKVSLFEAETRLSNLEYRLKENVSFEDSYLNDAIKMVDENAYSVAHYDNAKTDRERKNYEDSVKIFYENKYILDTKEDTNNTHTNRAILMDINTQYQFLLLVFVIMIAGGIVSDEFNKGTIKSMLITPYKRNTILMSKLITSLLMIVFFSIYALVLQLIVGSIFFGFSGLNIPVVIYNLSTKSLEIINLFKYIFIMFMAHLPQIILLTTLAFSASTIINNTAFSIAITFCGIIGTEIINMAAQRLKFLNYFVTTNWDFSYYLFGNRSPYGLNLTHSILVCCIYFMIMLIVTSVVFKKKDIKNI